MTYLCLDCVFCHVLLCLVRKARVTDEDDFLESNPLRLGGDAEDTLLVEESGVRVVGVLLDWVDWAD